MTTATRNDVRRLVEWNIVFVKRGLEATFPEHRELIRCDLDDEDFKTAKIAQFVVALPRMKPEELPASWRAKGYPPDGHLPPGDARYLRVYTRVLDSYDVGGWDWEEEQIEALGRIERALGEDRRRHRVRLPRTGRLSAALDSRVSEFGDEFVNFPAFLGARPAPGHTYLSGWFGIDFAEPEGDSVAFELHHFAVGTPVLITWGGGQQFAFDRTLTFPLPFLPDFTPVTSRGRLDLVTGRVEELALFTTFQGTTIGRTDRVNRIAYAFPFIFPPLPPPPGFVPPDGYRPPPPDSPDTRVYGNLDFTYDLDGNITGYELHSETVAPVGLFPYLPGFFPPFSFGPKGQFHFANPDRCLVGTPQPRCPDQKSNPDGIETSVNVFFHPHLDLACHQAREIPGEPLALPPRAPVAAAGAVMAAAAGRLYRIGGVDGSGVTGRVDVFDRDSNAWSEGPALPQPVSGAQSAVVGSRIYVLGGWIDPGKKLTGAVQVLDTRSMEWSQPAALPEPVAEGAAAAVGRRIYVVSGRGKGGSFAVSAKVQILDTADVTWHDGAPASLPVAGAAAVAEGTRIHLLGGRISGKEVTARTAVYETAMDRWALGPDLLMPTYDAAGVLLDHRLLLLGGRPAVDGPTLPLLQELPLDQDAWRMALRSGAPLAEGGAAVLDDALWAVGGRVQDGATPAPGTLTDLVQVFRTYRGWITSAEVPVFTSASVLNAAGLGVLPPGLAPGAMGVVWGFYFGTPGEPPALEVVVGGKKATVIAVVPPLLEEVPIWRAYFGVPAGVDGSGGTTSFELLREGSDRQAPAVEVAIAPVAPGVFSFNFGELLEPAFLEHGPSLAANQDGSLNCANQPSTAGETLTLWTTGLGTASDSGVAGALEVRIGGKKAKVEAVSPPPQPPPGLPPFAGARLVTVRVPQGITPASNAPVTLKLDGKTSNPVGVAIREEAFRPDPPFPFPGGLPAAFPWIVPPAPPGS